MGLSPSTPYSWIETDTLQMLNHQVGSDDSALRCDDCHSPNNGRIDLAADLGYSKWGPTSVEQC